LQMADHPGAEWLVDGHPPRHDIAERAEYLLGVVAEPPDRVPVRPATGVLQRLGQFPVIERDQRRHSPAQQPGHGPLVAVGPAGPHGPAAIGYYPGPGDREPVAVEAEPADEIQVLVDAAKVIAGDVAVIAVGDLARSGRERIPDRLPASRRLAFD